MAQPLPKPEDVEPQCSAVIMQVLAAVLKNGSEPERCLAVQALGRMGGVRAADPLIEALRDPDPDVRGDAAVALGRLGDPKAVSALKANLRDDPCSDIKVLYIEALDALGAQDCADIFCVLAAGRGDENDIAWDDEVADWDDWLDVQRAVIIALGAFEQPGIQADAVTAILSALKDPDGQDLWATACASLARLGSPGISALETLVNETTALNRKRIATALALAAVPESRALLDRLLKDSDVTVRIAAIISAIALGRDDVLHEGLKDRASDVRVAVLNEMQRSDGTILANGLNDIDTGVRLAACEAIIRFGKRHHGLGLTSRIERGLRTASEPLLAAMVGAALVAEPKDVEPLIEEIVNHRATAARVRCACLRGLGELNSRNAIDLLCHATGDKRQDVRLEAIAALSKLSGSNGPAADRAMEILASAISGDLIRAPADWQPEEDNVVQFVPKKGAQAAGDDGDAKIKLDRDGNVIDPCKEPLADKAEPVEPESAPTSTLEAIVSFQPGETEREIEISDDDLGFLELSGSRHKRRRLDPQSSPPAHIDVRQMAACLAGETGQGALVPALVSVLGERDRQLVDTALISLDRLGMAGVDVSDAEQDLGLLAGGPDLGLRCRAVSVMSHIATEVAADGIKVATSDREGAVRAAGLRGVANAPTIEIDPCEFANDPDRNVRLAAATIAVSQDPAAGLPFLLELAQVEDGVHRTDIASLLAGRLSDCESVLAEWVEGPDPKKRLIGLEMLPIVAAAV